MIAQLRGTLADKRPNQVLVDVSGVGYLVHIPLSTFYALGDLHAESHTADSHAGSRRCAGALRLSQGARKTFIRAADFRFRRGARAGPENSFRHERGRPGARGSLGRPGAPDAHSRRRAERRPSAWSSSCATNSRQWKRPEYPPQPVTATGPAGDVVSALLNLGYEQVAAEQAVERAGKDGASKTFEALLRATLQQLSAPAKKGARAAR